MIARLAQFFICLSLFIFGALASTPATAAEPDRHLPLAFQTAQLIIQPNIGGISIGGRSRNRRGKARRDLSPNAIKQRPRRRSGARIRNDRPNIRIQIAPERGRMRRKPPRRAARCVGGRLRGRSCRCSGKRIRIPIAGGYRCIRRASKPESKPQPSRPVQTIRITCQRGRLRNGRCICRKGRTRVRLSRTRYRCVRAPRTPEIIITDPAPRRPARPIRLACINGFVKAGRCRCRRGSARVKLGQRRYRCEKTVIAKPPKAKKPSKVIAKPPRRTTPKPPARVVTRPRPRPTRPARTRPPLASALIATATLDYLLRHPHRRDEVLVTLPSNIPASQVRQIARDYNLETLNASSLNLTGQRLQRFRIGDGRSVRSVVSAMRRDSRISAIQPNMLYRKSLAPAAPKPGFGGGGEGDGDSVVSPLVTGPDRPSAGPERSTGGTGSPATVGSSAPLTNAPTSPSNADDGAQYALKSMNAPDDATAPSARNRTPVGRPLRVAIIDSGIHRSHAALKGAVVASKSVIGKRKAGSAAHGTAIASIIAGRNIVRGVARDVELLDVRTFYRRDRDDRLETSSYMLASGIDWGHRRGARVFNLSFAGPSDPALERVFEAGHQRDLLFIAAAGNFGPEAEPAYPAAYEQVMAVTAIDARDGLYRKANRGDYLNVAAPGVDIFVATDDGTYGFRSGTSMAAAHASGLAALMLQRRSTFKPDDLSALMEDTAADLGPKGRDRLYGAGRIDARAALEAAQKDRKN